MGPLEQMGWSGVYADPPEREIDPEHPYADPAALMQHRQQRVREKLIRVEKAKVRCSFLISALLCFHLS